MFFSLPQATEWPHVLPSRLQSPSQTPRCRGGQTRSGFKFSLQSAVLPSPLNRLSGQNSTRQEIIFPSSHPQPPWLFSFLQSSHCQQSQTLVFGTAACCSFSQIDQINLHPLCLMMNNINLCMVAVVEVEGIWLRANYNFTGSLLMGIDSCGYAWAENSALFNCPRTKQIFGIHQKEKMNCSLIFYTESLWATS